MSKTVNYILYYDQNYVHLDAQKKESLHFAL